MRCRIFLSACLFLGLAVLSVASSQAGVSTYAPIPSSAAGPPIAQNIGYRVQNLGQGAYMATDGIYQSLFLVSTEGVIAVDAPPTIGQKLLYAIGNTTHQPVTHLVYSHAHADHIGAAYLLKKPVTIIAHDLTASELKETPGTNRPLPDVTFTSNHTVKVGNQTLELAYGGPNHEPGNIFIYAPKQKVLMLVDIVFPGWVPFAALGEAQNVPGFIKAHSQILAYDFTHYLGGRLDQPGTRVDVETQLEYVMDLAANCRRAIALSGLPPNATNPISAFALEPAVYAVDPGNSWALFKAYLAEVSGYCANLTTSKWIGRLAGADVFTVDNANTMLESLRIDYDVLGPFGVV